MLLILYLTTPTNQSVPKILFYNPEVLAFLNKNLISSVSKQSDKSQSLINSAFTVEVTYRGREKDNFRL